MLFRSYEPAAKFSEIASAEYDIEIVTPHASEELAKKISDFLKSGGVMMKKHTKSGEKEIDISALIYELKCEYDSNCGSVKLEARCSAGNESLNPEYIVSALRQYQILPSASLLEESYSIMRKRVLDVKEAEFR